MLLESASACASRAPEGGGRRADHGQPLTDHFVMQLPQMLFAGAFHAYGDAASPAGHDVSTVRQPPDCLPVSPPPSGCRALRRTAQRAGALQ